MPTVSAEPATSGQQLNFPDPVVVIDAWPSPPNAVKASISHKEAAKRLMLSLRCVSYVVNSRVFQDAMAERRQRMEQEQDAACVRQVMEGMQACC